MLRVAGDIRAIFLGSVFIYILILPFVCCIILAMTVPSYMLLVMTLLLFTCCWIYLSLSMTDTGLIWRLGNCCVMRLLHFVLVYSIGILDKEQESQLEYLGFLQKIPDFVIP